MAHQTTARPKIKFNARPDRGTSIPHPGALSGEARRRVRSGRRFPSMSRLAGIPHLPSRGIQPPNAAFDAQEPAALRCAAGGWRAVHWDNHLQVNGGSRDSTLSVLHHSPSVAHGRRSLTRVTLFFLVSKARPSIPLLAPNCSRFAVWSSISTGSQGSLKKQGTAWLGRAWRVALSFSLSTLSVQRLQLALTSPHSPHLTSPSRSRSRRTTRVAHSFILARPAPPAHTHAHSVRLDSTRPHSVATPLLFYPPSPWPNRGLCCLCRTKAVGRLAGRVVFCVDGAVVE